MTDEDKELKLYTTVQVAEYCQVTTETVRTWIDTKQIPALKINNKWRIKHADLKAFLDSRYHTGE